MPRPLYIPGETIDEGFLMFRLSTLALLLLFTQDPAPLKAGFGEIDISPAPGTRKIGWNNKNHGDKVLDPLYARAAAFECGEGRVGVVGPDLLLVHRHQG